MGSNRSNIRSRRIAPLGTPDLWLLSYVIPKKKPVRGESARLSHATATRDSGLCRGPTGQWRRKQGIAKRGRRADPVANAAWLAVQVMAHNLARWTARIGLGEQVVTTKTLRRRLFSIAGRLTLSARRLTLHLLQRWPWETQFSRALARLRALPFPA